MRIKLRNLRKETIAFLFPNVMLCTICRHFSICSFYWNPIKHLSKHSRMWKASVSCWKKMSSSCLSQKTRTLFSGLKTALFSFRLWSLLCQKFNLFQRINWMLRRRKLHSRVSQIYQTKLYNIRCTISWWSMFTKTIFRFEAKPRHSSPLKLHFGQNWLHWAGLRPARI